MQGMPFQQLDQHITNRHSKYEGRPTFCGHNDWRKVWKKCQTKLGQVWNWMPKQTLNSDFLESRNGFFVQGDLKAKLYRKKCSLPAFLQNSCRRAGWKLTKLWQMYSDCTRQALSGLANSEFGALLALLCAPRAKRKIKKRELTFKHISDAWWFHRGEGIRSWLNLGRQSPAQNG